MWRFELHSQPRLRALGRKPCGAAFPLLKTVTLKDFYVLSMYDGGRLRIQGLASLDERFRARVYRQPLLPTALLVLPTELLLLLLLITLTITVTFTI